MKVFGKLLRSVLAPVFGVAAMGVLLTGCGDSTDPTAVGLDELKFSYGLHIVDQGNGTVRLAWSGSNNESDFSGYNVYGLKSDTLIAQEGQVIKLLDDKGEPNADGKATLGGMGYNGTNWETPGPTTNADGDFASYPYYKTIVGTDAVLPSCMPSKTDGVDSTCEPLTAEGGASHIFNGETHIDMTGLKIGSNYCFTTLATLDDGKKVAQTTSEIRCIVPKAQVDKADVAAATGKHFGIDLEALRTACGVDGGAKCGEIDTTTELTADQINTSFVATGCNATTAVPVCIEFFSHKLNFTAGKNTGIQDLGFYPNGFQDATLPAAPKLSAFGEVQNLDGYSTAGQSLPVEENHVYAVANGAGGTTSFYYHLIYVSKLANNADDALFDMSVRVSNKVDSL